MWIDPPRMTGSDVSHVTGSDVTEGHVTPSGIPLGVRMRNRRLRPFHRKLATDIDVIFPRSSTRGGVLYDVRVLYLAWLPELTLVIYPFPAILFSFHWLSTPFIFISYICCVVLSTLLRVHFHLQKCFFYLFNV